MQYVTRDEFLELLGLTGGAFDQLQHAGCVALAFETPMPATPGRYLDLDLVAMGINLGLTPSLGREKSTAIVAGFFHQWASAVGHAEADLRQDFFMAVGGVGWDVSKKSPKLMLVTNGTVDEIAQDFRSIPDVVGFFTVNISEINSVVRWLAALTASHHLPQKLVVLHQFRLSMIADERGLDTSNDDLSIVIHMDGQGTPGAKQSTWDAVTAAAPPGVFFGWKNFTVKDHPMIGPQATMTETPTPVMISYQ